MEQLKTKIKRVIVPLIVILVLWEASSHVLSQDVLPSPTETVPRTAEIMIEKGPRGTAGHAHFLRTSYRTFIAIGLSMVLSVVIGILLGTNELFRAMFEDWVPFWMTIPTLVSVLVLLVWLRFSEIAFILSGVVASAPMGAVIIEEGVQDIDSKLVKMSKAFGSSKKRMWRHVYIPCLMPYIFSAFRYIFGSCWVVVVIAENFGATTGVGAMLRFWFGMYDITSVISWAIAFLTVVVVIEIGVLKPLEDKLFEWRA